MIEIVHTYTLTSQWHDKMADDLVRNHGASCTDGKLLVMSKDIADGSSYYSDVVPGLSVVILDFVFKVPIIFKRLKGEDDLYVIHLDFSDEMNLIHIEGENHKIGYKANLGLGVFDNAIENSFQPIVGQRVYAMRLFVSKELLNLAAVKGGFKKSKKGKKKLFFHDHIDSESKLIMYDLKNKSVEDPGFEIYLRGIALRLLAKFIDRYSNLTAMEYHISDKESNTLHETNQYLLNNLLDDFPGIPFLADMAGMSVTKYKSLFKKMFVDTPNNFFIREKMILANKLLKSGEFETIEDVLKYLRYKKMSYFSSKYFSQFGKRPSDDFES